MADVLINENTIKNIASAIRNKNGKSDKYYPSEMPQAINDIETGGTFIDITETKYFNGLRFIYNSFIHTPNIIITTSNTKLNLTV